MPGRSYRQYCALARALDVVGDRWSMLIVRNLLLGPQRWSDLRRCLPGVAKNLLSARLRLLAEDGIIEHREDGYALTERGAELERALFALADWGERHFMGAPGDDAFEVRYAMTSMRRKLRPSVPAGRVQLTVAGFDYWVEFGPEPTVLQGVHGGGRAADAQLRCGVDGFKALLFGGMPLTAAVDAGLAEVDGATTAEAWLKAWRG